MFGFYILVTIFGGIGLLCLLIGFGHLWLVVAARRAASHITAHANGRVVEYRSVEISDGESPNWTRHDPVIDFQDVSDAIHHVVIHGTAEKRFAIGEQVNVLYDPQYPTQARVVGFDHDPSTSLIGPIIVIGLGVVFVLVTLGIWVSR